MHSVTVALTRDLTQKGERKNEEENKKNILPPAEEDPSMMRTAMIMKLYPVVKKNYDDSELGHQQ